MTEKLYCGNFKAHHCGSCHDDIDYGYELSEIEGFGFVIEKCCTFPEPIPMETLEDYIARLKELGITKED